MSQFTSAKAGRTGGAEVTLALNSAMKQNAKSGAGGQSSVSMGDQECLTHFIYSALSEREVTT